MKEAVAMDIRIQNARHGCWFFVSMYHPNNTSLRAARKERLRLSAISTPATGWSGNEPCDTLYEHGETTTFVFQLQNSDYMFPKSLVDTFGTDPDFSRLRNDSVQCLRVDISSSVTEFAVKKFFSLDGWKEAFPSLRSVYLDASRWNFALPSHLLKHLRELQLHPVHQHEADEDCTVLWLDSLIRNKDCGIEEVIFPPWLLRHAELLDDTLRRVRSFHCHFGSGEDLLLLARSFERTKADGDNLVRLRVAHWPANFRLSPTVEGILRSRPNLQILELDRTVSLSTFVVLCPVFASSVLTTLEVTVALETAAEDKTLADGVEMLLQHPTIRDLDLTVEGGHDIRKTCQMEGDSVYHFERCVAEGLRSTSLRRFHLTVEGFELASDAVLTKMYENARENWSLMDVDLEGDLWFPWSTWSSTREKPSHPLPFPLTAFDFISSRNQYFSRVLMLDENTVPPGLWPLILEWSPRCDRPTVDSCPPWMERYDESVLFYLLTVRPHLVKGRKVESSFDADTEKSVDGPPPKRTRTRKEDMI